MCKPHKQNNAPRKMVEESNPRNRRERERYEQQVEDFLNGAYDEDEFDPDDF